MSILFTPMRLRNVEILNRIVFPVMNSRQADPEGFVTEEMISYYKKEGIKWCRPCYSGDVRSREGGTASC